MDYCIKCSQPLFHGTIPHRCIADILCPSCAAKDAELKGCGASNRGGTYLVQVYSGGETVAAYRVVGMDSLHGWFFTTPDGKFHRVSGTVTIDEVNP
jgi:hypothetical protein